MTEIKIDLKKEKPHMVGLDVGFSGLKKISNAFPIATSIPSGVISGAVPSSNNIYGLLELDEKKLVVTTEEGTFFVGQHAMDNPASGGKRTQVRDRANDLHSRVLFQTGIALSVPHEDGNYDVCVVTGLPNEDYDLSANSNLQDFLNKSFTVEFHLSETQSIVKTINVVSLEIVRQPQGTVVYNQFNFDKEDFLVLSDGAKDSLGIIDFGHFTTDFALFKGGMIVENDIMNGSTIGVADVYSMLKRKILIKFDKMGHRFEARDSDLDHAVRTGFVNYIKDTVSIEEELQECAKIVIATIAKEILDAWGNETNRLDGIIISGGGSYIFEGLLREEFELRKKQGFESIPAPEFSNVLGFFMYGCMMLRSMYSIDELFKTYINPVFAKGSK